MPESHGADVRQSPYVSRLAGIEPEGVTALAAACLVLCSCVNDARLVINPDLAPDLAEQAARITLSPQDASRQLAAATDDLLDGLYALQDAVFGSADQILAPDGERYSATTARPYQPGRAPGFSLVRRWFKQRWFKARLMVSGKASVTGAWWPVAIVASAQDWAKGPPASMAEMRHVAEKTHRMPEAVERNGEVAKW
jgi:hypothetical protein